MKIRDVPQAFLAAVLVGGGIFLLRDLSRAPEALLFLGVLVLVFAAPPEPTRHLPWSLFAGAVAGGAALALGADGPQVLALALLVTAQVLTGLSLAVAFTAVPDLNGSLSGRTWVAVAALLAALSPVWLGPLLEASLPSEALRWLVPPNPLLHLGIALDGDPLRGEWLYRHSPLGAYPYQYPPLGGILAVYWSVAGLVWGAAEYRRRRWRRSSSSQP